MRGKSHISLGNYLLDQYMPELPSHYRKAFLFGCIQPDRNPATYLKGSLRCQWLRGHNYHNARSFMRRISRRLEGKNRLRLYDYYTLGKLIHYTADAFTYAHNDTFPSALCAHRAYEIRLQEHFLSYLTERPAVNIRPSHSVMETIASCHRAYSLKTPDLHWDCRFALQACCCVLSVLLTPRIL